MRKKTLWLTRTAVMLALLIALQWLTKPLGQYVTGSCVNAILAVTALLVGMDSGITVALLSPIFAYLLGIAPNLVTVPAIMAGNTVFVVALRLLAGAGSPVWRQIIAWIVAAAGKFAVLYLLVVWIICGPASASLIAAGIMKAPMTAVLPAMFGWPQLVTALIGGGLALLIIPVLRKALGKALS